MTELCGVGHPEDAAITCDKARPCFVYHASAAAKKTWPGVPLPEAPVAKKTARSPRVPESTKSRLADIARRAR